MKNKLKEFANSFLRGNKAVLMVIVLMAAMVFLSPVFFTTRNLLNVLRQVCVSTILACGFTMILGSGSIDLSVGSLVGITGIFMAQMMVAGVHPALAIFFGILIGACLGLVNAAFTVGFRLPPFIVTLAMQQVLRGMCYLTTGMMPVTGLPKSFSNIGQGYLGPIPIPVFVMLGVVALVWLIVNRTRFGRYMLAMGGNIEAARVSGINVTAMQFGVYASMGVCAAIAAVILTARASSAQPTGGLNMEMDAIAAVVMGGTSMAGGSVNVVGAFFGCLVVGIVNNSLNLLGVDSNWQTVAKGALILIAVILDSVSTSMYVNKRSGAKKKRAA